MARSDPDRPRRGPDPGLPGRARDAGPDRLCGPPGHRPAEGGRNRLRLGCCGRGRRGGLPDRQAQGLPRDRERWSAGQGRLAAGRSRRGCRVQLPGGQPIWPPSWAATAPQGIDVYFENVTGARTWRPASQHMNPSTAGTLVCGMISQYDASTPAPGAAQPGADDREAADAPGVHRLRPRRPAGRSSPPTWAQWLGAGRIKWQETVSRGDRALRPRR